MNSSVSVPTSQAKDPARSDFDVLIVGSGSAGAVLASRLSENSARQVLLEAGLRYMHDAYPPLEQVATC